MIFLTNQLNFTIQKQAENINNSNKKLLLSDVSKRSELLSDFEKWLNKKCNESYYGLPAGYVLDVYKKSLNCC